MTGAMYAAIAGLKTHMSKLNVIGNNIANVNTNGYKSQRTIFKDAMYTMYSSGSDGTTTTGGKNPSQIGYGSQISSIDLNMSTGSYAPGAMIYGGILLAVTIMYQFIITSAHKLRKAVEAETAEV